MGADRDTLQLWTQIVGKVRMAPTPLHEPLVERAALRDRPRAHHVARCPPAAGRSRSTSTCVDHRLDMIVSDGQRRAVDWRSEPGRSPTSTPSSWRARRPRAGHADLADAGRDPRRDPVRPRRRSTRTYDAGQVERFWLALVQMDRVFEVFRSRFVGKVSPVHLFWGALDLAVTRFSGRPAPPHPGGAPNCGPARDARGLLARGAAAPATGRAPTARASSTPTPTRSRTASATSTSACPARRYDDALGEFVLPYEAVRTAADPDALLLDFLQATYEAAADSAPGTGPSLERP